MGRAPCCEKIGLRRGRWTAEEDQLLSDYIQAHGEGSWRSLPKNAGLLRCGKSCRLRWINYLRSDVKRGNISPEEEDTIVKLHAKLGNRWSLIAGHLSGRTDNEIKNYWNSHLSRKISPSSSPSILTKRRSSAMKIKKPRKTTSTVLPPSSENSTGAGAGAGTGTDGEVIIAESSNSVEGETKEKEIDELFDDEGLLMDMEAAASHVSMVLNEQEDVLVNNNNNNNSINSASSSTDDDSTNQKQGGKQDNLEWEWESCDWDFEGVSMVGLNGGELGDDDIMSWPWESESESQTQPLGLDVEKQEAFIAWLLS